MLGLVISLVATMAPASPAAGVTATCGEGPASCDLAPLVAPLGLERHQEYATPAVIDCRSPVVPPVLAEPMLAGPLGIVGECDGPHDASYRTSRYPESEDNPSLTPASREQHRGVTSCDGLPQNAPMLPLPDAQPLALPATPVVVHVATAVRAPRDALELPSRFGDPPDRPPRI